VDERVNMEIPTQITFDGIAPSEALEAAVGEAAAGLERYFGGITSCHASRSPALSWWGVVDAVTKTHTSLYASHSTSPGGSWRITCGGCGAR
jgi:hypothetical protein